MWVSIIMPRKVREVACPSVLCVEMGTPSICKWFPGLWLPDLKGEHPEMLMKHPRKEVHKSSENFWSSTGQKGVPGHTKEVVVIRVHWNQAICLLEINLY